MLSAQLFHADPPGSIPGVRKLFVGKVLRRVIFFAPWAVLHQEYVGHRWAGDTLKSIIARCSRMDFGLDRLALHNFLMRTRLEPPQAPENLFSISFGGIKVWHGEPIFHKYIFLQGLYKKSSLTRSTIPIIPHEEASNMTWTAHTLGTNT